MLLLAGLAAGCAMGVDDFPGEPTAREVFGRSALGRPIRGLVLGSGPETHLLFGVIHGNEPLGAPLLERLAAHLEASPELLGGKRVVIIPVLNPDGLARGLRTNARGVDLNRNFPSRNWKPGSRHGSSPASEPETRALLGVLRKFQPARILSIHSPLHCVNYDGPAEEIARDMAHFTGYPLRPSIGYPTPGSLGTYAGEDLDIPTITLELPPHLTERSAWPRLGTALERFVTQPGVEMGK